MARKLLAGTLILVLGIFLVSALNIRAYALRPSGQPVETVQGNKQDYYLLALTNNERSDEGLQPLTLNDKLITSATDKCNDMVNRNYWGHFTPDGKSMDSFITKTGIRSFSKAGENLAIGQKSLDEVNNDWMNSPTHREAIMDSDYTDVGFASCVYQSNNEYLEPLTIYVEHFLAR